MFSLARLFGKEDRFFALLEASAEEARHSVQAMVKLAKNAGQPGSLEEFAASRRADKKITQEISEALTTTFVTSIEREDIETLSNALYKIPKTVEKFAERINLAPEQVRGLDFSRQTALIELAVETLVTMVRGLRRPDLEQVKSLNDRLQQLEGDADKAVLELLREVYQGQHPASKTVLLKDLFDLLEKVIDRCRDAGNVVTHIVLKNS
jgi:uncharacterized protein Yka (UPF0111/DUF47 family)